MASDDVPPIAADPAPNFWSREAWRVKPPRVVRVGCISASSALIVAPLGLLLVVLSLGWFQSAPKLPSWAYPEGDVLHRYNGCGGNGDDLPPCRTIEIGTDLTMPDVISELRPEFVDRGWHAEVGPTGESLWVQSPNSDVCIGYHAFYRAQAEANARKYLGSVSALDVMWTRYSALITVYVDDCSSKG